MECPMNKCPCPLAQPQKEPREVRVRAARAKMKEAMTKFEETWQSMNKNPTTIWKPHEFAATGFDDAVANLKRVNQETVEVIDDESAWGLYV